MVTGKPGKGVEETAAFPPEAFPPDVPEEMAMAQRMWVVHVRMQFRVPAVDGSDAIQQVTRDLGQGRSYKYSIEETLDIGALPIPETGSANPGR